MTTVTLKPQQGAQELAAPKTAEFAVTDAAGRVIFLKKPGPLANLDFKKALGSNHQNVLYLAEVMPLAYVVRINEEMVPIPTTDAEIRALYQRLGDDGNAAVQQGVADHFFSPQEKDEQELKNS